MSTLNKPIKLEAFRDLMRDPFGEYLFIAITSRGEPRPAVCTDLVFTSIEFGKSRADMQFPAITVEAAQQLMESLWHAGIRPSQAAGSIGQLGAVQAHLQDMRELVFKGGQPK